MARFALPFSRAPRLTGNADAAALALRVVVGSVMAYHGYRKVEGGVSRTVDYVRTLDVPLPELAAYLVVVIELVGGLCLLVGLLTRLWSLLVAAEMVAIVFKIKSDVGLIAPAGRGAGFELDLLIAVICIALLLMGPGSWSVDRLLRLERPPGAAAV